MSQTVKAVLQNSIKATFFSAFAWWIRGIHSEHEWFLHQTWIVLKLDWTMRVHITFKKHCRAPTLITDRN